MSILLLHGRARLQLISVPYLFVVSFESPSVFVTWQFNDA